MQIAFGTDMFERSAQPVMLLAPDARLTYANPAAERLLPLYLAGREAWKREIDKLGRVPAKLPKRLDLAGEFPQAGTWEIWLSEVTDSDSGYALMFCPLLRESAAPRSATGELALIGSALREELKAYSEHLQQASRGFLPALATLCGASETCLQQASRKFLDRAQARERDRLIAETQHLALQFLELAKLSELHERSPMDDQERIAFDTLIARVLAGMPGAGATRFEFNTAGASFAPVYGNPDWLSYAVRAYLLRLGAGLEEGARISLALRQLGDLLVLDANIVIGKTALVLAESGSPEEEPSAPVVDIRLMLAERLLHMLGGEVEARPAEHQNRIEAFTIRLPASHPHEARRIGRCQTCPETRQALEYAKELATRL